MQKDTTVERFDNYSILPAICSYTLLHAADDSGNQSDLTAEEHERKQQTNECTASIVAYNYSVILLVVIILS